MKKIILFVALFITVLFSSCIEEVTTYEFEGQITGPSPLMCPTICCGGWFIDIEGESYHFLEFPANSEFSVDDTDSYPVSVKLDYETSEECWENSISIIAIEAL